MRVIRAVKMRVTLFLIPVSLVSFACGFVFGENMGPKMISCSVTINTGMENYGKPSPKAEKNNWY